jgi:hypothetical protein
MCPTEIVDPGASWRVVFSGEPRERDLYSVPAVRMGFYWLAGFAFARNDKREIAVSQFGNPVVAKPV